jgi:hypothetical protein
MHNHSLISTVRVRVRRPLTKVVGGVTNSRNAHSHQFPLIGGGFLSRSCRVSLPIESFRRREGERGREEEAPEGTSRAGLSAPISPFPGETDPGAVGDVRNCGDVDPLAGRVGLERREGAGETETHPCQEEKDPDPISPPPHTIALDLDAREHR